MSENLICSFCNKSSREVKAIVAGTSVNICNECVMTCHTLLMNQENEQKQAKAAEQPAPPAPPDPVKDVDPATFTPRQIREYLDQYVVGQENAKITLSVAVSNHYRRINQVDDGGDDTVIQKSNAIMVGPSGSGKTFLIENIAKFLNVPFVIADSTSMTENGYVGDDVESILSRLLQAARYDLKKAQMGIVFIDEIDKKAKKETNSGVRDVSGEGVQQALLKMLEGTEIRVTSKGKNRNSNQEMVTIDTKNILFIVGGAFVGLEKIISQRLGKNGVAGFTGLKTQPITTHPSEYLSKLEADDLIAYGLIPELVGRLPVITYLEELTEDQLVKILVEPKNAIMRQYRKLFAMSGMKLDYEDDSLLAIAEIAKKKKTGARGLRSILEKTLIPIQYKLPDLVAEGVGAVKITKALIDESGDADYIKKELTN